MAIIYDEWTLQPREETMDERCTAAFLAGDENAYWMISDGQRLNLYEDAIARAEAAEAEVKRLREVLADIAAMTDVDDPQSYRCDDPRGCLDTVHAKALAERSM